MTTTAEIAEFLPDLSYDDLSAETRDELKKRLLDTAGIGGRPRCRRHRGRLRHRP
jgi:2-methylcitrate dehydratase PrpD